MGKKNREREAALPGLSDEVLGELAARAQSIELQGDGFVPLLDELNSLTSAALAQFCATLARGGQETAVPLLSALAQREELAPAAVEALGWTGSQEAARQLLELAEHSPSREVRKAAGRGLHRLRSLGLHVKTSPPELGPAPETAPAPQARPRAWASSIDGFGSRFLFLSIPKPMGGNALIFLMLNDKEGIQEARAGHIDHEDEASARVEALAKQSRLPHVEIPVDYARHLVKEGRKRGQASGRLLPTDYMVWKELIGEPEEDWERPPVYRELNAAQVLMEPGLLEESDRLLDLGEFRNWLLETEQMRPHALEMEKAKLGGIVLSEEAQGERVERVLSNAMEEVLGGEYRALYRRRLEEMSYLLLRTGREREAKRALAAAQALEQDSSRGRIYLPGSRTTDLLLGERSPLIRHPFFRRLVGERLERALAEISKGRKVIIAG